MLGVSLRKATNNDLELMLKWRNDLSISQGFYSQRNGHVISWTEHIAWWQSRNQDWRTFIIEYKGKPVGIVTIGQLDHWSPEIGFYVGKTSLWNKGIGKKAVMFGLEYIRNYGREYAHTTVLNNNERSIRLLKGLGFEILGPARPGESWYQVKL